jgi:hypothetical protein
MVRQYRVMKTEDSTPMLIASKTTGIIKTILFWSEHRTQARQTMMPSAIIN